MKEMKKRVSFSRASKLLRDLSKSDKNHKRFDKFLADVRAFLRFGSLFSVSEPGLGELWAEVHLVHQQVKDGGVEVGGGGSSDSSAEVVDSWIEIANNLKSDQGGHLDPDSGADWASAHLFDVSITVEVALSGFSIDSFLASNSVEVGVVGSKHQEWQVSGPGDVYGDISSGDVPVEHLDLGQDAIDAEAVVALHHRSIVHHHHLVEVQHSSLHSVRSL